MDETLEKKQITLPLTRGKSAVHRVISIYASLFQDKYGFKWKGNYAMYGKFVKQLLEDYTEVQLAFLLIVFFNWKGMADDNQRDQDFLCNIAFPITAFMKGVTKYEAYTRNVLGKDFDNEEALYKDISIHFRALSS
jgi:hypothetical protein